MYGILLSEDIEDKGLTADMISDVEEYDRKGHTLLVKLFMLLEL